MLGEQMTGSEIPYDIHNVCLVDVLLALLVNMGRVCSWECLTAGGRKKTGETTHSTGRVDTGEHILVEKEIRCYTCKS